ncbi:hypothetical protein KEM55_001897, partial [Ascosphaera atra]
WFASLKLADLQRVATVTGLASSGTKTVLAERINTTLQTALTSTQGQEKRHGRATRASARRDESNGGGRVSLLSVDMGIRNLAFAHLVLDSNGADPIAHQTPVLSAWNRLDISSLDAGEEKKELGIDTQFGLEGSETSKPRKTRSRKKASDTPAEAEEEEEGKVEATSKKATAADPEKNQFTPDVYARHAYSLVTSLVAKYQPTHFIIERQRFRSGGGSAVQEWTIRVGMFEAMLYAVLYALRQERGNSAIDIAVEGVDPKRVARYWIERYPTALETKSDALNDAVEVEDATEADEGDAKAGRKKKTKKGKGTVTAREVKKAKINVLAGWLSDLPAKADGKGKPKSKAKVDMNTSMLALGSNALVKQIADSYLARCSKTKGGRQAKKTTTSKTTKTKTKKSKAENTELEETAAKLLELGKLDDLADCVLQGVAWIEWQQMRRKLAIYGPEGME